MEVELWLRWLNGEQRVYYIDEGARLRDTHTISQTRRNCAKTRMFHNGRTRSIRQVSKMVVGIALCRVGVQVVKLGLSKRNPAYLIGIALPVHQPSFLFSLAPIRPQRLWRQDAEETGEEAHPTDHVLDQHHRLG